MFPPFDPERDDRKRRPRVFVRGQVPVRVLIPNIFTLVGLCAGLTAIRMGIEHRWDLAVAALVFAAFLDGIDGHVARLLKASSRFGAELDSLADFVNFGVAPAIIMFNWALRGSCSSLGWIAVLGVFRVRGAASGAFQRVSSTTAQIHLPGRMQLSSSASRRRPAAIVLLSTHLCVQISRDSCAEPHAARSWSTRLAIALLMVSNGCRPSPGQDFSVSGSSANMCCRSSCSQRSIHRRCS